MNKNAVGIIFPNVHDRSVPELVSRRTIASVPFAGRYRLIDFVLSGMARAGFTNVAVIVRQNYQSLLDHLGNGREWDLSRKRGGLVIFPPYVRGASENYEGKIEGLSTILPYLANRSEDYVVLSDGDIACNIDYHDLVNRHIETGADVTTVYNRGLLSGGMRLNNTCYKVAEDGEIKEVRFNDYKRGEQNISMHTMVMKREFLISTVQEALVHVDTLLEREVFARQLKTLNMRGYCYEGYCARICDMKCYFDETMRLLDKNNLDALFPEDRPVYTKVRDEAPVRYAIGAKVRNSMVADGCIIEGEVDSCVLFRGVRVGKGAKLKNCVIMQAGDIRPGADMMNVITDKNVTVGEGQVLRGAESFPVFVAKNSTVGV